MCVFLCMLSTCWQKWFYLLILDQVMGFAQCQSQLVKNLPAMRETWVRSLSWKMAWRRERLPTPVFWPGKGKGYPLQYSGLESSMDCIVPGVVKSQTRLSDFHFTSFQWFLDIANQLNAMKLFTLKWSVWGFPWQSSGGQSSSSPKTSSFSDPGCAGFNPWSGNCPWPKTQNIKKKRRRRRGRFSWWYSG